jgi:MFS family permease
LHILKIELYSQLCFKQRFVSSILGPLLQENMLISADLGSIGASWTTYGTFRIPSSWSWRIPSLLQGIPAAFTLVFVMFLPESPRWYISKDRGHEALKTLADCHANGDTQDELIQAEYWEISEALRIEKETAKDGIKQLWATKGNRKRLLIIISLGLFGQWAGKSSSYLLLACNPFVN